MIQSSIISNIVKREFNGLFDWRKKKSICYFLVEGYLQTFIVFTYSRIQILAGFIVQFDIIKHEMGKNKFNHTFV